MHNTRQLFRHLALLGMIALCTGAHAQANDPKAAFEAFRRQAQQTYSDFRKKCLSDYADFVRKAWDAYEGKSPIPKPKDDMDPPVVRPKEDETKPQPEPKPIVIDDVIEPQPVKPQPEPIEPIIDKPQPVEEYASFIFYGTKAKVRHEADKRIILTGTDGNAIADALIKLGDGRCDNTLYDCLALRKDKNLCDWAYLMMLKEMTTSIYSKDCNEATLMMAYLYMQSGYQMRLAESDGKLYMLFASDYYLYGHVGYALDGVTFFGVEQLPDRLNISLASFPKESRMSLLVNASPILDNDMTTERERSSERYPNLKVTTAVNKNWLDFCSSYPTSMIGDNFVSRWAMYANTPMSIEVKEQLYPQLQNAINGKTQLEATNILLNWVQTGFEYEYDDKVWGGDRAFFAEESLHYPFCDCEDRSILFTRLVRDLLGLKCILIYYPGHLACAVHFTESVSGDYIMLNEQKFIVTDPTYIGAPVGMTMRGMDNNAAKVILLK